MHAKLKAAQSRLEKATAKALCSFVRLHDSQTDVCNSLKSHSSAKMAAVKDYEAPPAYAPKPPETPAEAASENGVEASAVYFDEDTQIIFGPQELSEAEMEEKLTKSKLLEKKRKNHKISGSSQMGLASP